MQTPTPPPVDSEPATKADLRALKSDMHGLNAEVKSDMHDLKSEVKSDMRELKSEVKSDVRELKSDMDARLTRTEDQLSGLQQDVSKLSVEVARIGGQIPHMATAESVAKLNGDIVALQAQMQAGFADLRALFAERVVPLEEFKRKTESRYRYATGVAGALVIGFAVTAWKVFIGA